jgi:hypothetical protein
MSVCQTPPGEGRGAVSLSLVQRLRSCNRIDPERSKTLGFFDQLRLVYKAALETAAAIDSSQALR